MCPSSRYQRSEIARISDFRPAFDVLDADHDGKISLDDLRTFYTGVSGAIVDEEAIDTMISVADSNKDGFIEFDEFEAVLGCRKSSSSENEAMRDAFKVMDRDGDGKVGFDDLKSYMNWAGFCATDEDIRAMIKVGGGDEMEGVCFEGMLKILSVDLSV